MSVGYLGPPGTFTHEALLADLPEPGELVAFPSIRDTVVAVQRDEITWALVPIENSTEGSVSVTLDTLVHEAGNVRLVGEIVHPIRHCLIGRAGLQIKDVQIVLSHPHAIPQCAAFLRSALGGAEVRATGSTAEAVRVVAEHDGPWAALGSRLAAERYGCTVLAADVEDNHGNETRFVWLSLDGGAPPGRRGRTDRGAAKTAIVFWGPGADAAGWLVACLREFADRSVNLTRIESRPRRQGLGSYMFFVDIVGDSAESAVAEALAALRERVEVLRVLGSFS